MMFMIGFSIYRILNYFPLSLLLILKIFSSNHKKQASVSTNQ